MKKDFKRIKNNTGIYALVTVQCTLFSVFWFVSTVAFHIHTYREKRNEREREREREKKVGKPHTKKKKNVFLEKVKKMKKLFV